MRHSDAIPSFIHVEKRHQLSSRSSLKAVSNEFSHATAFSKDSSVEQTALFLKQFSISRDSSSSTPHHNSFTYNKRRGRPATSRMRGKHGLVKSTNSYSSHCRHHLNDSSTKSSFMESGPFNKDTRLAHLKKYMQSRRLRLRQRTRGRQTNPLDCSDMSLDEADVMDEDDNDPEDIEEDGPNTIFALDHDQYSQYMWDLKERLCERTSSATKSRSHFLQERRLSAGGRVDHVQRVVQRQRTEQEKRQDRARDQLEQKMMRAMARRNAYLEAAIENDPSRRFRRKSSATAMATESEAVGKRNSQNNAVTKVTVSAHKGSSSMRQSAGGMKTSVRGGHEKGSAKNSGIGMTQTTKKHLTNMTSTNSPEKVSAEDKTTLKKMRTDDIVMKKEDSKKNNVNCSNIGDPAAEIDRVPLIEQRRARVRLVQQATREYMQAIGGSHERVLGLSFEELAKLLHTNKTLIQATVRLLKYSSMLVQMDGPADQQRCRRVFSNPARVFLSMYMVLAHPEQIRSPEEPNQTIESNDPTTEQANDDTFDSLVESSKALLEALQAWMTATNKRDLRCDINSTCETTMPEVTTPVTELATATIEAAAATTEAATATTEAATATAETATATIEAAVATTEATIATTEATKNSYDPMLLQEFDQAWTSYYNLFQAWKDKDAKRLLQTLLDHAQQIESLWRTVQSDPSARTEWEPRIEEQRRDLRAKAGQLAGAEGTTRLDAIFADFVNSTTSPVITSNAIPPAITSPTTPPTTITSPVATPPTTTPRADTPPTDAPMIDTPIADTQMDDAPATDTPMDDAPATGTPMVGPSVVDTSVADPSVVDTPVVDPSVVDTPVVTSMVDTPMVDTPMVDTPMTDGLTDDISSNATTVTTTPTIGSPIADNSIVDNSIDDNLTVDDSTADESTVVVPTDATTTTTATPLADNSTTDIPTTTIFTPNITIADVISTAATPPVATPPSDLPAPSKPADESSSPSTHVDTIIESPATPAKKRQRASSSKGNVQGESTSQSVLTRANSTGQEHLEGDPAKEVTSPVDQEQPKAKKTAKSKSIPSASVDPAVDVEPVPADLFKSAPPEVEKPEKWSNLRMVHELALDTNFKLEHKKSLIDTAESIGGTAGASVGADGMQSLEARIRAIATKAYFDKIREDAEEGNLGKWIPSLLTTIRDQLLDMLPPTSAMAVQISEGFDIEFVQQQVDKNVYDIKAALESVLKIMSELCAPVRDPAIRELMDDLSQISKDPLTNDFDDISSSASTVTDTARYSAAYVAPKDLVSVLQGILELLELMLMDLANFRLTMARPKLEKEAVPYEQNAFKDSLRKNKTLLDTTKIWLEESAKKVLQQHSSTTAASLATAAAATSSTDGGENGHNGAHRHIYYEILVHGILDLVFSSKHFDVSPDREMFPSTLALDRERMSRYQNEVQGLAMVAIILNISLNVPPVLKDDEQKELKLTLLRLMESPRTSVETLAEAVIEAKEKSLLSAARRVESSSRSSSPLGNSYSSSSSSSQQSPTGKLLLTSEEKSYIHNAISRAISFDSTLYKVLSDRVRKALESVMISAIPSSVSNNNPSYVRVGHMPDQVSMRKMGLGALTSEIETLAGQIRFLTKYNAQVYRQWYDPMLNGIIIDLTTSSSSSA